MASYEGNLAEVKHLIEEENICVESKDANGRYKIAAFEETFLICVIYV